MKQRVTFGSKDKRRDQRRPISIEGSIRGLPVRLVDVSFAGVGGALELRRVPEPPDDADRLVIAEGDAATLDFAAADGQPVTLQITILRVDPRTGAFGATFSALSSRQFDVIERLMFPRRSAAKG